MLDHSFGDVDQESKLLDHQPLKLNEDDYTRVCKIPKRKVHVLVLCWGFIYWLICQWKFLHLIIFLLYCQGANFRDLEGVKVGPDNVCYLDKDIKHPLLPSGKPLASYTCICIMSFFSPCTNFIQVS